MRLGLRLDGGRPSWDRGTDRQERVRVLVYRDVLRGHPRQSEVRRGLRLQRLQYDEGCSNGTRFPGIYWPELVHRLPHYVLRRRKGPQDHR